MRRVPRAIPVLVAVLAASCHPKDESNSRPLARFAAPASLVTPEFIEATGFSPDHRKEAATVYGFLRKDQLQRLPRAIFEQLTPAPEKEITPESYEGYHDYRELTEELQRLADTYPQLIRLETAGRSVRGRELWYVVVSDNVTVSEPEPKFIYHANMHGDEAVGRELMIYFIRHLMDQYGQDARINQLVDNSQIYIMPSMNPDGFELGRRANANGYDLNRNFPDRFRSPTDSPARRQIEVQHMMRLAEENHFVYGINWHGGEICFNLPWGNISNRLDRNKYGDDAMFYPIGREYTELNQPMYANHRASFNHGLTYGYEWYPISGGINDWYNYYRRSVHAVVELSVTKWPHSRYLQHFWDSNREAMVTFLWRGLRGVHLEVRDEHGDLIPSVEVDVASSRRTVRFDGGYVNRLTGEGAQTVTIRAAGFTSQTVSLPAEYFNGVYYAVVLER